MSIFRKNILLSLGLIISIASIGFNVFVFGFHNDKISQKEEEMDNINFTNLYLSNEFNHAENMYFKGRNIQYLLNNLKDQNDSDIKDYLETLRKDLDLVMFKSTNYAYNSTIVEGKNEYDSIVVKQFNYYVEKFVGNKRFTSTDLMNLKKAYDGFYLTHENHMKESMVQKEELRTEIRELKQNNSWMNFLAISFQTIGLLLVFLKDIKKD